MHHGDKNTFGVNKISEPEIWGKKGIPLGFKGSNKQSSVAKTKYSLIPNNSSVPRKFCSWKCQR